MVLFGEYHKYADPFLSKLVSCKWKYWVQYYFISWISLIIKWKFQYKMNGHCKCSSASNFSLNELHSWIAHDWAWHAEILSKSLDTEAFLRSSLFTHLGFFLFLFPHSSAYTISHHFREYFYYLAASFQREKAVKIK